MVESAFGVTSVEKREAEIAEFVRTAPLQHWMTNPSFEDFFDQLCLVGGEPALNIPETNSKNAEMLILGGTLLGVAPLDLAPRTDVRVGKENDQINAFERKLKADFWDFAAAASLGLAPKFAFAELGLRAPTISQAYEGGAVRTPLD